MDKQPNTPYIPLSSTKLKIGPDGKLEQGATTYIGDKGEMYPSLKEYYKAYPDRTKVTGCGSTEL